MTQHIETLFILRDKDQPLHAGDVIEAQGMLKYLITVKRVIGDPTPVREQVQYKIKGVREVVTE